MVLWIYAPYSHERIAILDSFYRCDIERNDETPDALEISTKVTDGVVNIKIDSIIWPVGDKTAFLVHSLDLIEQKNGIVELRVRAQSLETLLSMRVLEAPKVYTGSPGAVCDRMCHEIFSTPDRAFAGLSYDFSVATGDEISIDASGNLLENIQAALSAGLFGIRSTFDPISCAVHVSAHKGIPRNVIFDEDLETLAEAEFADDAADSVSMCYVTDNEEGTVQVGDIEAAGYQRREGWILHAAGRTSYDSEGKEITLTDAQYTTAMKNTGAGHMSAHRRTQTLEGKANLHSNLVRHGIEFELGDVCTVRKNSWDVSMQKRITSIVQTIEGGTETSSVVFGNPSPTISDKIKRGE